MEIESRVKDWGGSKVVLLPTVWVKLNQLHGGSKIRLLLSESEITIRPVCKSLEEQTNSIEAGDDFEI